MSLMSIKPDLGTRLVRDGITNQVQQSFYQVAFQGIDVLSQDAYTSLLEIEYGGEVHAVSFDFNESVFLKMASLLSTEERARIGPLLRGKSFPFSIELPTAIVVKVLNCRLGEVQRGALDSFIPLVVTDLQ